MSDDESRTAVADLGGRIASIFTEVVDRAQRLADYFTATPHPAVQDLDEQVEWLVAPSLDESRPTIGAGFVAAPNYLPDAPWHLAWWLSPANGVGLAAGQPRGVRRLRAEEDPHADGFHDFTRLEWWRVPTSTGRPHLTGPYIDYLCTDELTVTITVPVTARGELTGVVGADLSVAALERLAEPVWQHTRRSIAIVSARGRVIAASDPTTVAGALLGTAEPGTTFTVPGCADTLSAVIR